MTVIVDNFRTPATVRGRSDRWSHLTATTQQELHEFAVYKLRLARSWFQDHGDGRWHYDLTDAKRTQAIRLGAQPVDIRELGEFVRNRRLAEKAKALRGAILSRIARDSAPLGELADSLAVEHRTHPDEVVATIWDLIDAGRLDYGADGQVRFVLPDLAGFEEAHGVQVSCIGEEGTMVALGHIDKRRAVAAFNAYVKWVGFDDLRDYTNGNLYNAYARISHTWAVIKTQCHQPDCEGAACGECKEIKAGQWWMQLNQSPHAPRAFPVTDWS